jgi:hypothetical protein
MERCFLPAWFSLAICANFDKDGKLELLAWFHRLLKFLGSSLVLGVLTFRECIKAPSII